MKKLKVYLGVALFGAMSFGAFSAYDYATMSAEERALLGNIEALTYGEGGTGSEHSCYENTVPGAIASKERWCHDCILKSGREGYSNPSTCTSYL